jgi:DNA-binding response OmpR family regulator
MTVPPDTANAAGTSVLVVEDDHSIATQLVRALARGGYQVDHVVTGQEALRWGDPDVVLLDLELPDTDGVHVCRQLRQRSAAAIIVVTAFARSPTGSPRWTRAPTTTWSSRSG